MNLFGFGILVSIGVDIVWDRHIRSEFFGMGECILEDASCLWDCLVSFYLFIFFLFPFLGTKK